MELNAEEVAIADRAKAEAKTLKKAVYLDFSKDIVANEKPVLIMMSGAPGAGKTEVVQELMKELRNINSIDPDSYRPLFKEYNGDNSHLFQGACTALLSHVYENAVKNKLNIILDTNLINFDVAMRNLLKASGFGYKIMVYHVSLDPYIAWRFVKTRTRKILPETFKRNVFLVREVLVKLLQHESAKNVRLTILHKWVDLEERDKPIRDLILYKKVTQNANVTMLDMVAPMMYSREDLEDFVV